MLGFIFVLSMSMSDEWQAQIREACANFQDAEPATAIDFSEAVLDATK